LEEVINLKSNLQFKNVNSVMKDKKIGFVLLVLNFTAQDIKMYIFNLESYDSS
jgi:hypothetical protein